MRTVMISNCVMATWCVLFVGCGHTNERVRSGFPVQMSGGAAIGATLVPGPNATEEEVLRKAILSVHAFIETRRDQKARVARELAVGLRDIPTMRLGDAVEVIMEADDVWAELRKQRTAVRLLAHARDNMEAVGAVELLIGRETMAAILAEVKRKVAEQDDPGPPEKVVSESYAAIVGCKAFGKCKCWKAWSDEDLPEDSHDISIVVTGEATPDASSSFDGVRRGLDPQSWGGCSKLWKVTYLAEMQGAQPVLGPDGKPKPAPKNLGNAWGDATLYEEFVCDDSKASPPCDIRLLIDVKATEPAQNKYDIAYGNHRHFPANPTDPSQPLVVTDKGWVTATKTGNDVEISSAKVFGFQDRSHSLAVLTWLEFIEEQSYLGELACCLN